MTTLTSTLICMPGRSVAVLEREWCEMIASLRVEDGRRWIVDNELVFHDAYVDGQLSITEIRRTGRDHFFELVNPPESE